MKKLLIYLCFFPAIAFAQPNPSDTLRLKADLSLTGFFQWGNVETLIFRAKSEASYRPWKELIYNTRNSFVYQAFGGDKADQDFLSLNFLYINPDQKIHPLLIGIASTNFRMRIDLRYLVGVGATFKVIQKKKNWLTVSVSSEYETTRFNGEIFNLPQYNGNSSIITIRGTVWVNGKHPFFDDKLIFSHESYFQPSLHRRNNYRWRTDLGLEFPLQKLLSFKINYVNTFESIVIENQRRADQLLTVGLTLKSY